MKGSAKIMLAGFWIIILALFGFAIAVPAAVGNLGIIMGIGNNPHVITSSISLQATQSIGLAVLAAALSAVVTWFGRPRRGTTSEASQDDIQGTLMRHFGISFLVAALFFTLFASLSQLIPEVRYRTDAWGVAIRYTAGVCVIGGSVFLTFTSLWGLLEIIRRGLVAMLLPNVQKPTKKGSS